MFDTQWPMYETGWASPVTATDAWFKAVGRIQVETVAYMTRSMLAAMELPQVMGRCQTPAEIATEQLRFLQVAQREYLNSLDRMMLTLTAPTVVAPRERDYLKVQQEISGAGGRTNQRVEQQTAVNGAIVLSQPAAQPIELRKAKIDAEAEVAEWLYKKSA